MNRYSGLINAAMLVLVGLAAAPTSARPPTVGINPGYDRRLVESRQQLAQPDPPPATIAPPMHKRHVRHRN